MGETVTGHADDLIDFALASRVCAKTLERVVPLPRDVTRRLEEESVAVTDVAYQRVSAQTGLVAPGGPPRAIVFDRLSWAQGNIASLSELLGRIDQPQQSRSGLTGSITRASSGVEIGLMLAWLSRRVLGQFDMVTGDAGREGIYYVGPNIYNLELRYGFAPSEFRLWIALHEVTHYLQFDAVPWMRGYFLDLVSRATVLGVSNTETFSEARARVVEVVRRGENPLMEGGVAALLAGTKLYETLREAQALMSLLEGHAEYVMSVTAPELIPGAGRFARVLRERRTQGSLATKFFQQALGFEAKLRQYREGHAFIEEIVTVGGDDLLALVFKSRDLLPSIDEIREPSRWIARVGRDHHALS